MGYVIAAIFGIFVAYLLLWLCVAAVMLFVLPGMLLALPLALVGGVVLAFVVALLTLTGTRRLCPETITPARVLAGTAGLRKLKGDNPVSRDPAWPTYLASQSWVDLRAVWNAILGVLNKGWRQLGKLVGNDIVTRVVGVVGLVLVVPLWAAANVSAVAAALVILALTGLVFGIAWGGWALVAGGLRGADALIRRLRGASGSCPNCYYVTKVPGFPCDGCLKVHHDIRPGLLGGVWRRCECGTLLPTTVLRAAHKIAARCPRCDGPLREGAAVLTDIRMPVFGPVSAGKTRLVLAGLVALRDATAAIGGTFDFVDEDSKRAFTDGAAIITSDGDTVKTPAGELPRAITARVALARRRALLHLFDAAGEFYGDREDNSDLEFLDHAQGLVLVVDPFSIPSVRDQLSDVNGGGVDMAHPAHEEPERVYQVTARRLRDFGVNTKRRALAVTVVKADLLSGLPPAKELHPDRVREWLVDAGLDNLVLSAERDFGEVRYFVTASVSGHQAGAALCPANPFVWLISRTGLELAPQARPRSERAEETA